MVRFNWSVVVKTCGDVLGHWYNADLIGIP